jgi:hypothetical protein
MLTGSEQQLGIYAVTQKANPSTGYICSNTKNQLGIYAITQKANPSTNNNSYANASVAYYKQKANSHIAQTCLIVYYLKKLYPHTLILLTKMYNVRFSHFHPNRQTNSP